VPIRGKPLLFPPPVYSDKKRESSVVRLNIIITNDIAQCVDIWHCTIIIVLKNMHINIIYLPLCNLYKISIAILIFNTVCKIYCNNIYVNN
jgi:hypothetical protein